MIDLHIHTKYSDGTDSCEEILKIANKRNLEVISITDHNTVKAYAELKNMKIEEYYKGKIIPGVELNTKVLGIPIEILGYGIDWEKMNELLPSLYIPATERNKIEVERLYNKCINANIKLDKECLERYDSTSFASKFIHSEITKYEENKKIIEPDTWNDTKVFYRKYMSNPEGPLYVEMDDLVPDFNTASNLIKQCGGLVFIPHIFEYRENAEKILDFILSNYDIDGIECYYTTFSNEQTQKLLKICDKCNLYKSGGSDYHGDAKKDVHLGIGYGDLQIDKSILDDWIEKIMF